MEKMKCFIGLMLLLFITGCSNYNMSMKIDKDKSMDYTLTILSNYYNDTLNKNISIYKEKFEQYGYLVEDYNIDNKYGMIISKKFDNIDDISYGKRSDEFNLLYLYTDGYDADTESKMFNVDEGIATNRYAANFYVDLSNLGLDLTNTTITYSVELPNVPLSSNATFVSEDKKTLTWNITSLGKTEIDYVFELNSYDNIYYIVAILIAIYLLFSILSNLFRKSGDDRDNVNIKYNNNNYNSDMNKKIENITNNAIKNSSNNVTYNNIADAPIKTIPKASPAPSSVTVIPPTKVNNIEMTEDITNFKTPDNKNNVFAIFEKKEQNNESSVKINDNEEFNKMINNVNNGNINSVSTNEESVYNSLENSNISTNEVINNKDENDISNLIDIPVIYNDSNISNNTDNIHRDSNSVLNNESIYTDDSSNKNTYVSNESINITNTDISNNTTEIDIVYNNDINSDTDNSNQSVTFQSLNEDSNDGRVIIVNNKSIVINNDKKEE